LGHLSARLAHDIRSPLAAMEMGLRLLAKKIPQNECIILTNGIQSVRDIANNVLERYRNPNTRINPKIPISIPDDGNVIRPILLCTLVEMIVSQKRHEWSQYPCELLLTVKSEAKMGWIKVAPNEVKRLLSNLLNNAYDALIEKKKGAICIVLTATEDKLYLQLCDNGVGIPSEKIDDVLSGVSLKHVGNGLGLSSAKIYMESLGGKLHLSSTLGNGTNISLIFSRIDAPSWFSNKISLGNATTIVVLEDDFSMLMYWQQRINETGLSVKLFSTYDKALQWIDNNKTLISSTIFIADYALEEESENGLMFLEKSNDSNNRYLITSHAEEFYFQKMAEEADVWLIPKSLVGEIALTF